MEGLYSEIKDIILWGTKEKIDFSHRFRSGSRIIRKHKFEGVIPLQKEDLKKQILNI